MPLDLKSLALGDPIHHPLMVLDVNLLTGEHPRTVLTLGNSSGRIQTAPFWPGRDEQIQGLVPGMIIQVVGKISAYRDSRQLEATSVRLLPPGSIPLEELVPSVGAVDRYWNFIDDVRERFSAPRLRSLVDLFFADDAFRVRFQECPGAPGTGHHASLGGLLQHTCEVILIGRQIARVAHADEDLVVAGAMLHDIGKTECYDWQSGVFQINLRGRLNGHVAEGAMMFRTAWEASIPKPSLPEEALLMEHMILSHHGKLEFGAPVRPATLEAEILNFADDASAKTTSFNKALDGNEYFRDAGSWVSSSTVWDLDRRWVVRPQVDFGRVPPVDSKNETADQEG